MSDQVHIAIDVSVDEDQIHGHLGDGVGQSTAFSGWLELLGLLDDVLGVGPRPPVAYDDRVLPEEKS